MLFAQASVWYGGVAETQSPDTLLEGLLDGYRPTVCPVDHGQEGRAVFALRPHQAICYYPGKLHGGYQALLIDQLLADCCRPAVTASLSIDYKRPIEPGTRMRLRVWPVKRDGRKIHMEGSIMIPTNETGAMVLATQIRALFVTPK